MKVETITRDAAKEILSKVPERQPGKWTKILDEAVKSGQPTKVSDLTRGQCWGLKRAAKDKNVEARVLEKSSAVLLVPQVKGPK